jgi:DNA helicase-4
MRKIILGTVQFGLDYGINNKIGKPDNNEVKSLEELRIYNWLYKNGIKFEYERPYEISTTTRTRAQYHPDFFYPEANLYHEHFALSHDDIAPIFFKNYERSVLWKRALHIENETKLIETKSANFWSGDIFKKLEKELKHHKIKFNPIDNEELDELINKSFEPTRDTQIFSTFLHHFKSNNMKLSELDEKVKTATDPMRSKVFIELFKTIYSEYEKLLNEKGEIDFEDQINQASNFLENGTVKHQWKYVLVDEFQDISQDRKRFVLSLINQNDRIKLFAVGDDWQAIYRFSGADIRLTTQFEKYFGTTTQTELDLTFRFNNRIGQVAADFIIKNPTQLNKKVASLTQVSTPAISLLRRAENAIANPQSSIMELSNGAIDDVLQAIHSKACKPVSVFLLGRFWFKLPNSADIQTMRTKYPLLKIEAQSFHASKGKEAEAVSAVIVDTRLTVPFAKSL